MFYKLGKKIFQLVSRSLGVIQIALIFLSFATIFYWILQLAGITFIQPVAPFFESIKDFTHTFYTRTVAIGNGTNIDFVFLISAILMLAIAWIIKFSVELLEFVEKRYDVIHSKFKKEAEKLFNAKLNQSYNSQETKNNKFLVLVKFNTLNLTKDKLYHKDTTVGSERQQKLILTDFSQSLSEEIKCEKKLLDNSILLYFNNIKNINKTLICLENIIKILKHKYNVQKWQIDPIVALEVYAQEKEVSSKVKSLMMLHKLNLENKIVCVSTFRQRSSLIENLSYGFESQGIYKIGDNEEEVFCLKK